MEADQHVRPGSRQGNQALVVDLHGMIAAGLAQRVAVHGQLREHRQIGTGERRLPDPFSHLLDVGRDIAEHAVDLTQCYPHWFTVLFCGRGARREVRRDACWRGR